MSAKSIVKVVLYGIAIVAPGGLVGIAGYHFVRFFKKKRSKDDDAVQDSDGERKRLEA